MGGIREAHFAGEPVRRGRAAHGQFGVRGRSPAVSRPFKPDQRLEREGTHQFIRGGHAREPRAEVALQVHVRIPEPQFAVCVVR